MPSPSLDRPGPAPLVVALHGCTQTASDFAAGTRFDAVAERAGAYVLYPEQTMHANPRRCWNWFLAEHQGREAGEPSEIISLVEEILARYPIDSRRVFVAGLSAGGAMAAILAEQAPDVFAAAGIMAGVPMHASFDVPTALAVMKGERGPNGPDADGVPPFSYGRLRVSVWTGLRDRVVVPENATALVEQFVALCGLDANVAEREEREGAEVVRFRDTAGNVRVELWRVANIGHAWSGGSFRGSHTDPNGPRASDELMAFFLSEDVPEAPCATRQAPEA